MSDLHSVIKAPLVTEKNTNMRAQNKYVFEVDTKATKTEIKRAAEKIFGVKVLSVNTMVLKGKLKRYGRYTGYRIDRKKAIITLPAGAKIKQLGEV